MQLNEFTFHAPATIKEAVSLYSENEGIKIKAGGTFLINILKGMKKRGGKTPQHILSLNRIAELKIIDAGPTHFTIGAMVTMADILNCDQLTDNASVLKSIASGIGNTPIRNMATLGGNLACRYTWTEMPTAILALEAQLHFMSADEKEEVISAKDFFLQGAKTQHILTKVSFERKPEKRFAYQRATKTTAQDIPILSVCAGGTIEDGKISDSRLAINSAVSFAQRDYELEDYLNQTASLETIVSKKIPGLDKEIYTTRSDDYKQHMFGVCIKRALGALK